MKKEHLHQAMSYMIADLLSTVVALVLFNIVRFYLTPELGTVYHNLNNFLSSQGVILSIVVFAPGMLLVYALSGFYYYRFARGRTDIFLTTLATAAIGTLLYFFTALLNDVDVTVRTYNYELMIWLFSLLLIIVFIPRWFIATHNIRQIRSGQRSRNALIIGTSPKAVKFAKELTRRRRSMGFKILGFVNCSDKPVQDTILNLPVRNLEEVEKMVKDLRIECIVMVMNNENRATSMGIINRLFPLELPIFLSPDRYQLLLANGRFRDIAGEPLIDVSRTDRSPSLLAIKRTFDVLFSGVSLIISLPVIGVLAAVIKHQSPGPVFYKQERIGYLKRRFKIYKLRSMRVDSEKNGPQLSSVNDPRITRIGAFMRKYRLDELPNFWNVLIGDMSIVGPRPEREHFIKQILEKAPYYSLLHQVRPGITSWGMVKFGYATTTDQMIERLKYDMAYLENMSLAVDMKIMFYTIRTVVTGRGI